ncbi:hypothetical protein FJTKL_07439 [Diaporthe vaccinii]|uniref:C2H2-type domain-containing protein n=1 Tax=Diaporthe vaccinii TaxID=105482 RepID=A0ABR4DRL0_9PEZI
MEAPDLRSPNRLSDQSSSASYPCFACGMIFSRNDHLKRHAQLHAGERPFVCPKCERRFSRSDTLQRHMTIHAPQRRVDQIEPHPGEPDRNHHARDRESQHIGLVRKSNQMGLFPLHFLVLTLMWRRLPRP